MTGLINILSIGLLSLGSFFALTGALGLLRMPDFYSRVHPAGKSDTLGQSLLLAGLILQTFINESYGFQIGAKLLIIIIFIFITSSTATHAITKGAHLGGLKPWQGKDSRDE